MTPAELEDRMERILKTCANLTQALKYIEGEAKQVIHEIHEADQLRLFEDEVLDG